MTVSISAWADRIGIQNRKIAAAHKGRQEAYDQIDAADQELQKIQAKYTDGGDGDADGKPKEPSAEDIKAMQELEAKIVAGRKAVMAADENIAKEEAKLAEYKQEMEARERHNRTEERLNSSAGRSGDQGNYASAAGSSSNLRVEVKPPTAKDMEHDLADLLRATVQAGSNVRDVPRILAEDLRNDRMSAAMQSNIFGAGGAMVPDQYIPTLIGGLFATAVVRSLGIPEVPVEFGSLEMPRIVTGAIANYTGEGQDAQETSVTTDQMRLVPKQLIGLLPMSNTFLAQSSPGADGIMMQQLQLGIGLTEDRNFLRGPASGAGPTGLRNLALAANVFTMTGTSIANIDTDAGKMENALMGANVPMIRPFWLMSVRTFIYLNNLRDGNSNKIYPSLDLPTPLWRGKPVKVTTQIPINLSGSNTEIMLLDASQQLIGQNPRINIAASTEGSYKNAAGQQVNAFERNETILRIVMWNDINTMHPESIAVLTGVTY